jgi:hypothetical protein
MSDVTGIYKIDRMDRRSLFTSHYTRDGKTTLCGLGLEVTQPFCDNGFCRRCEKIFARCQIEATCAVCENTMSKHATKESAMKVTTASLSKRVKQVDARATTFHWTEAVEASNGTVKNVWMVTAHSDTYAALTVLFEQTLKLEVHDVTFNVANERVVFELVRRA